MALALALVGAVAFVVPGSAWATTGHTFAGHFGGLGNSDGQFGEPNGRGPADVAVMPSTGEVFTADAAQVGRLPVPRVQRFDAAGVFQSSFELTPAYADASAVAVGPGGLGPGDPGAVYVGMLRDSDGVPAVLKYTATGVSAGELAYALDVGSSQTTISRGSRVAVDPVDGTVYVTVTNEFGAPLVASFDAATGAFIASFDGSDGSPDGGFCAPKGLAVDGSHQVYVLDDASCKFGAVRVDRYSAAGAYQATVDDGSRGVPSAVAADPVSDEVYVSHPGPLGLQVTHFSAGGAALVYTFDAREAAGVRGMAVSGAGEVYLSDSTRPFVVRYGRFEGPTVVTGDASSVEERSAVLEGTINPEGVASTYHFEYGTDFTYGKRSPAVDADAGSGSIAVAKTTTVDGLQPNKLYHYRIVGSNGSGSIAGPDREFTTLPAPVDIGSSFASAITPRSARLHNAINPNNAASANYYVKYGTTTAYGSTATGSELTGSDGQLCIFIIPCGGVDIDAVASLSGLEPGTTYHYRVFADSFAGGPLPEQFGPDQTFITAPAAGGGATGVTASRARLTGMINPHGVTTTYHFNYGPTSSYGSSTPEVSGGTGDGDQVVSREISGLAPDTTYHVQVVATSDDGVKRYGADGLFRTAPAPSAVAVSPIGVSTDAATLVGDLDTYGLAGTYRFDVSSLDSSYSFSTVERAVAGSDGVERVSVPVDGLPAGETFVVRLVVTSNDSTQLSDQITFATASLPPRVFPPPPVDGGASSYGCAAPRLDSYNAKPKPGDTITISGRDLGTGGTAVLGDRSLVPADWSTSGFKLEIPEDATGTLGLTVNCGKRSNTITIAIFKRPSSRFSIANTTVNGAKATLSVKVPGPGKLTTTATNAKPGKVTIKKARGAKLVVKLNRAGIRALRRSKTGRLKVPVRVRYLPAGGRSATKTITVTFKHTARR